MGHVQARTTARLQEQEQDTRNQAHKSAQLGLSTPSTIESFLIEERHGERHDNIVDLVEVYQELAIKRSLLPGAEQRQLSDNGALWLNDLHGDTIPSALSLEPEEMVRLGLHRKH